LFKKDLSDSGSYNNICKIQRLDINLLPETFRSLSIEIVIDPSVKAQPNPAGTLAHLIPPNPVGSMLFHVRTIMKMEINVEDRSGTGKPYLIRLSFALWSIAVRFLVDKIENPLVYSQDPIKRGNALEI